MEEDKFLEDLDFCPINSPDLPEGRRFRLTHNNLEDFIRRAKTFSGQRVRGYAYWVKEWIPLQDSAIINFIPFENGTGFSAYFTIHGEETKRAFILSEEPRYRFVMRSGSDIGLYLEGTDSMASDESEQTSIPTLGAYFWILAQLPKSNRAHRKAF